MPSLKIRLLGICALTIGVGLAGCSVVAADTDGRLYPPSSDQVADLQQAISRADAEGRLALVVVGANWCHDSRALASRLYKSPLAELVQENYELVFVDVGYYEKGGAVLQRLDVAQFYATPTVLIVDPSNGRVINNEDRHIWGNAYNIDMPSSVEYFERWTKHTSTTTAEADSAQLQQLYTQIDQFEQRQAERVAAGYAVVGPMLAAYEAGDPPQDFDARWNELRDFRVTVPRTIRELRHEAERRVAAGEEDIQLAFAEYPALSWESD